MKKSILCIALVATFTFSGCSSDDDSSDLTCEQAQARLTALGEDGECDATLSALEDIKKACGDDSGDIQTSIDVLKAICELGV